MTSALHKSQVSWNIWPLSTKRGQMEKNLKIILNVANALLRVWRKYWFQKNDGNFYDFLNHFFPRDHILKVHNLRKHTDISDMKYRCSICPYATIENAALKKHIRFKHTHDVRNPFLVKSKAPTGWPKSKFTFSISSVAERRHSWPQVGKAKMGLIGGGFLC